MSTAKCVAGDDEATLAKLRRNIQSLTPQSVCVLGSVEVETIAAATFYELYYPIKFAIFVVNEGLCTLMLSNMQLFCNFF